LDAVSSLGVSLQLYKKNEKWEWTSLLGGEKRILLRKLAELFDKFLPPNKVDKTRNLWIVSNSKLVELDLNMLLCFSPENVLCYGA